MSGVGRPVVLVVGARSDDPPPGIGTANDAVELRYAADRESLRASIAGADALFAW